MTEDDLKKRTKLFALRLLKLVAALPKTIAGGRSVDNWRDRERQLRQTIVRPAGLVQERSSSRDLESLKRKLTKALCGWD